MRTERSKAVDTEIENEAKPPFHLVLLHDGETALAEARQMIERLLTRSLAGHDLYQDELSFSEIAHPEIRTEAADLAAECDLFILATVNGFNLPNEVVTWLHLWFESRREKEAAFVCLIGSEKGTTSGCPVQAYLQHLTEEGNVGFFSTTFSISGETPNRGTEMWGETFLIREAQTRAFPRPEGWGINE